MKYQTGESGFKSESPTLFLLRHGPSQSDRYRTRRHEAAGIAANRKKEPSSERKGTEIFKYFARVILLTLRSFGSIRYSNLQGVYTRNHFIDRR